MKQIIFNHIPKTAGSTFLNILQKQYGTKLYHLDAMNIDESINYFRRMSSIEQNKFTCISGHLSFKLKTNEEMDLITMLRDPMDQFLSTFYYIKRATWNRNHKIVSKMKSITEFVEFSIDNNFFNLQTRYLADDVSHIINNKFAAEPVGEIQFQQATDNLNNHKYVFVSEKFDEAILILKSKLGWNNPYYKISNKTKNRKTVEELTEKEYELINNYIKYDRKIYDLALNRHSELLKEEGEKFNHQMKLFGFKNKLKSLI